MKEEALAELPEGQEPEEDAYVPEFDKEDFYERYDEENQPIDIPDDIENDIDNDFNIPLPEANAGEAEWYRILKFSKRSYKYEYEDLY